MIEFRADTFAAFAAAVNVFHTSGVEVTPSGGNQGRVPDDTDWPLVEHVAHIGGVTVWTDLPEPQPTTANGGAPQPAKTKTRARRTRE